jgi:hypothetical protein
MPLLRHKKYPPFIRLTGKGNPFARFVFVFQNDYKTIEGKYQGLLSFSKVN